MNTSGAPPAPDPATGRSPFSTVERETLRRLPPLLPAVLAYLVGLLMALLLPSSPPPIPLSFTGPALLCASVLLWRSRGRDRSPRAGAALLLLLPALLGTAAAPVGTASLPSEDAPTGRTSDHPGSCLPPGPCRLEGVVVGSPRPRLDTRHGADRLETVLRVRLSAPQRSQRETTSEEPGEVLRQERIVRWIVRGDVTVGRGDRVRAIGVGGESESFHIPSPREFHLLERSILGVPDRLRASLRRGLRAHASRRGAAWGSALLLGDRELIPPHERALFRRIGQSHLLAISGLHVGILALLLRSATRRLPARAAGAGRQVSIVLLLLYALIAGAEPPVLRATIFCVGAFLVHSRAVRPRLPELWALSFLVVTGVSNEERSLGLWLSFLAVAAIALALERRTPGRGALPGTMNAGGRKGRRLAGLLEGLRIASAAWIGTHLLLVHLTPELVLIGPPISVLLAPWMVGVLVTTLLATLPDLGGALALPLDSLVGVGIALAEQLDRLPGTPTIAPPLSPVLLDLLLLAALALLCGGRRLTRGLLVLTLAALLFLPNLPRRATGTLLLAPPLGQGQGVYILGGEETILLDAGSVDLAEGGAPALHRELWREGRDRIDLLVLSHPHADHVLAVPGLLRRLSVSAVLVPPRFGDSALGAAILAALSRHEVEVVPVSSGDRIRVGSFTLDALHPPRESPFGVLPANDDSLVIRVRGEGLDLLAPGDLEGIGLASIPSPPRSAILLLPHHGRGAPGLLPWVRRVSPVHAIACGGPLSADLREALGERVRLVCGRGTEVRILIPAPEEQDRPGAPFLRRGDR
jgi:ComEC/Rec2-related protein